MTSWLLHDFRRDHPPDPAGARLARAGRAAVRRRLGLFAVADPGAPSRPAAAAMAGAGSSSFCRRIHPRGGGSDRVPAGFGRPWAVGALFARNLGRGRGHLPHPAMARLSRLPAAAERHRPRPRRPPRYGGIATFVSRMVEGPLALGLLEPRIVIPSDFSRRYSAGERRLAMEHELTHHRHRDIWWNVAAILVLAFNWFNPLAWLAYRAFRADQELACDAAVAARATIEERCDYARALVKSASGPALVAACPINGAGNPEAAPAHDARPPRQPRPQCRRHGRPERARARRRDLRQPAFRARRTDPARRRRASRRAGAGPARFRRAGGAGGTGPGRCACIAPRSGLPGCCRRARCRSWRRKWSSRS